MIRIITGLPGSGKSLRLVYEIKRLLGEGRNVYVHGLDGLQPFGWEPLENPRDWRSLPDGSVVVVDESQKVWPTRRAGDVPDDIRALSEHRHHGFDFVLATQHPTMLDAYVRKLVGEHVHVMRQFGTGVARLCTWSECFDDPQSVASRSRGTQAVWRHPPELYTLYKSATLHTVKSRIPFRLKIVPVLLIVGAVLAFLAVKSVRQIGAPAASSQPAMIQGGAQTALPQTPAEYVAFNAPRVSGLPWSAPIFDQRKPQSNPDILCVSVSTGECTCYTEQITRLDVDRLMCKRIARYGIYNPYRQPLDSRPHPPDDNRRHEADDGNDLKVSAAPIEVPTTAPRSNRYDPSVFAAKQ